MALHQVQQARHGALVGARAIQAQRGQRQPPFLAGCGAAAGAGRQRIFAAVAIDVRARQAVALGHKRDHCAVGTAQVLLGRLSLLRLLQRTE
ncbi:hypothetical protein [Acidovorax lacteus]|uniref:hypothetical protein n=1 Tax=Acidovorax lacteus TaxID=1924988 RepID=UPI0031EC179B